MTQLLMPKATAVWLVENTALTFDQIAAFTGLHALEVQAIADGQSAVGMKGWDPVANGQLTQAELDRCAGDPAARLVIAKRDVPEPVARSKGPKYTPLAKRQDKPNGVAWLLKHHPELTDAQISKLIGTTKPTIQGIRDRTHWNIQNIKAQDPVQLGLCNQAEIDAAVQRAPKRVLPEEHADPELGQAHGEPAAAADSVESKETAQD